MEKYISKSALVAEIERRIKERDFQMKSGCWVSSTYMYEDLLDFINASEVKEVEESVSKELNIAAREYSLIEGAENIDEYAQYDFKKYNSFKDGAKWQKERIELGIKAQEGE